jgi:hypothetical protein
MPVRVQRKGQDRIRIRFRLGDPAAPKSRPATDGAHDSRDRALSFAASFTSTLRLNSTVISDCCSRDTERITRMPSIDEIGRCARIRRLHRNDRRIDVRILPHRQPVEREITDQQDQDRRHEADDRAPDGNVGKDHVSSLARVPSRIPALRSSPREKESTPPHQTPRPSAFHRARPSPARSPPAPSPAIRAAPE